MRTTCVHARRGMQLVGATGKQGLTDVPLSTIMQHARWKQAQTTSKQHAA